MRLPASISMRTLKFGSDPAFGLGMASPLTRAADCHRSLLPARRVEAPDPPRALSDMSHRYKRWDITIARRDVRTLEERHMARQATTTDAVDHIPQAQYRCICCDGTIENLSEETLPVGLDLRLGLVTDECALVCNACTAKLIDARTSPAPSTGRRR
jgi:hypothetical protein